MSDRLVVNEHYMNRVVAISETAGIEATEDILAGNGMKLVAKGARIDARFKERLLQHKLRKPLETCVRVVDGAGSQPLDKLAESLLDSHRLLAGVCGRSTARLVTTALRDLRLSTPMESLLSVYAAQGPHKLAHAAAISLLGASMYHDLPEGGCRGMQTLIVAGLLHDVGELYVDPALLRPGTRLSAEQWKHIAAHPIVGSHVLRDMPGAGAQVAEAVLYHHERLDGFGYPHGLRGTAVPLSGQVLALAEMLMGLIDAGHSPGERASVATKLIPGEFHRRLLDRVSQASRTSAAGAAAVDAQVADAAGAVETASPVPPPPASTETLTTKAVSLHGTLQRVLALRQDVEAQIRSGSPALKELMTQVIERCHRIRLAFSSTGLDTHGPQELDAVLSAKEPQVQLEVSIVLREIEWRLRELKRETVLRAERLPAAEAALVRAFVERSEGRAKAHTAEPAASDLAA